MGTHGGLESQNLHIKDITLYLTFASLLNNQSLQRPIKTTYFYWCTLIAKVYFTKCILFDYMPKFPLYDMYKQCFAILKKVSTLIIL